MRTERCEVCGTRSPYNELLESDKLKCLDCQDDESILYDDPSADVISYDGIDWQAAIA